MDLSSTQLALYKQIRNKKLKDLLKDSYTFYSMNEDEKDEFLIWASRVHFDKKAEKELIQTLMDEAKETNAVLDDPGNKITTSNEKEEIKQAIENEYDELAFLGKKLKTEVSKEKEKEGKIEEKKQMDILTKQLNNL